MDRDLNAVTSALSVWCLPNSPKPDSPKPDSPKLGFRVSVSANRVSANRALANWVSANQYWSFLNPFWLKSL